MEESENVTRETAEQSGLQNRIELSSLPRPDEECTMMLRRWTLQIW